MNKAPLTIWITGEIDCRVYILTCSVYLNMTTVLMTKLLLNKMVFVTLKTEIFILMKTSLRNGTRNVSMSDINKQLVIGDLTVSFHSL